MRTTLLRAMTVLTLSAAVTATSMSTATAASAEPASDVRRDAAISTTGDSPTRAARVSLGLPTGVRVIADESGMWVYATPHCSLSKTCTGWIEIPGTGIQIKEANTAPGRFVPWPSSWREGQTVSGGFVRSSGRDVFGYLWYTNGSTPLGSITRPYAVRSITARLASKDDSTRSATITGTATPGASIYRGATEVARVDQWGSWSTTVRDLPIGSSTLTFTQWIGNDRHGSADVTVSFAGQFTPVTVTGPASVNPGVVNTIRGKATPDATFQVVDDDGSVIVPGGPFRVDSSGNWSFDHLVPSGSTEFRFTIVQSAWGQSDTSDPFTLPADTLRDVTVDTVSVRDGVANTFTGTATPGATYRVLNVSDNEIVAGGPFRIDESGKWSFDRVVSRGATEFRFKLEQDPGGRNERSRLFTIPVA